MPTVRSQRGAGIDSHRTIALLLVALTATSTAQPQEETQAPKPPLKGVYVMELGGQEIGREEFELTSNGWRTRSSFDILGVQKGEIRVDSTRTEDGSVHWSLHQDVNGRQVDIEATRHEERVTGTLEAGGREIPLDFAYEPPGIFYGDLVWCVYIDLGRHYAEQRQKGELRPGYLVQGVMPNPQGMAIPIELKEVDTTLQPIEGRPEPLVSYRLVLADRVEVLMICRPDGLPLRFSIPSQSIEGFLEGYESVVVPRGSGRSVLDRGEWRNELSQPDLEVEVEEKVMIPMRDGVKLAADVHRPKTDEKVPTVLVRTAYGRKTEALTKGQKLASRGYVVVAQDVRGRFDSEGEWYPLRHETNDGSDTIDWIVSQPWSDGKVGMIGASYVGWVQWYAARSGNPHLKAIVPQVSPPDPDQNIPYEGGVFLLSTGWWAKVLEHMEEVGGAALPQLDFEKKLLTLPLGDLDQALGTTHPFLDAWIARSPIDPAWSEVRYQPHYSEMNVAVLNVSGWFDGDQPGAPQNFVGMREHGPDQVRAHQFLIMGPWGHAFNLQQKLGDVDFGDEAVIDLDAIIVRFFDRYLKGIENGFEKQPPVMTFTMGANRWYRESEWPPGGTVMTKLYLGSPGQARRVEDGGFLSLEASASVQPDAFRYDPHDPRVIPADYQDMMSASATADVSGREDREDYLDYVSPPLATAAEITGPIRAVLSVSTDAADTDFSVEVYVIEKDGAMRALSAGIQRLRYRNGKDEPVPPGEIVTVEVDCWATSRRLEPGDRLRVVIGSCLLPGYARNLNTLEAPITAKKGVVATNRVHHDDEHASHLLLSVVPRENAPGVQFADKKED